jgi:hypothetical protein
MKRICLETTVLPVAVPNAVGPALKEINGRHLLVAQSKSPFGRTTRQTEVPIPIQVAQSRESALFAKLVEISASSLGALGLWTHGFTGNYGVTRAEKS